MNMKLSSANAMNTTFLNQKYFETGDIHFHVAIH